MTDKILVAARSALLDALEALDEHRNSVIVIGAQAIYLHTGGADIALAEATKDSDLAIDPRELADDPLIEDAMVAAGFYRDPVGGQPGAWMNATGVPVDLMVPEDLAGPGSKTARAARIPPHSRSSTRRAKGLEAVLVDNHPLWIESLTPSDSRRFEANVAGPAALSVAKLHKIGERATGEPTRLIDKDAHDLYRIFRAIPTGVLAANFALLLENEVSVGATREAIRYLNKLFATGPDAVGSVMAGRAEFGIGSPDEVSNSVSFLAEDLLSALSL